MNFVEPGGREQVWTDRIGNDCGRKGKGFPHLGAELKLWTLCRCLIDAGLFCACFWAEERKMRSSVGLFICRKRWGMEKHVPHCAQRFLRHTEVWFGRRKREGFCRKDLGPKVLLCSLNHSYSASNTNAGFPWS